MIRTFLIFTISSLVAGTTVPSEKDLLGTWGCTGQTFVFMESEGSTPPEAEVDAHMKAMGASGENCTLTFTEGHRLNFKVGDKAFDMTWSLDAGTAVFKTAVGPVTFKGYLVKKGDSIILTYARPDLFMIMRFMCSPSGRKHIAPLGSLLDTCKGLTLGMEFSNL